MQYYINTDGGSRGNPGPSACAFVVFSGSEATASIVFQQGLFLGVKTNNEAEYLAVLSSLKWLKSLSQLPKAIIYRLDSKLVVEQLSGRWKIKDSRMQILANQCQEILTELALPTTFTYIPRAQNAAPDALLNQVLDKKV